MASNLYPFLLVLYIFIAIISAVGRDFIAELAWRIYTQLPSKIRAQISKQKSLQKDILQTSAALKSVSSQDEFAKWARLNRQHDKEIEDLKKLTGVVEAHKSKFRRIVKGSVWLGTTGLKGGVQWWYRKEAVFWLPVGTFPQWAEYIVAFPKAPRGGVSTMVFGICATRVIALIIGLAQDVIASSKRVERPPETNAGATFTTPRFQEITAKEETKKTT